GAGTLPMLLVMGGFAERLQRVTQHKWTRYIAGILLVVFGAMILSRALGGGHRGSGFHHGPQASSAMIRMPATIFLT
ncbi:MAG TPA: hypothetical protein ENJ87_09755, partial [Gammaproteobacteria bacterium]|nr:hypothetical protein [Gammaproteobacteria bacterium]